ncbi:MAG: TIGR02996 domain-containing protein [Planctomycetes bacterium]|nr:TIGR02996 domain-containing protein [Planctomycetota bacterium]
MTSEADFQRALDANPDDWQTRLVFADWLDERNDPRADGYRALGVQELRPFCVRDCYWWTAEGDGFPYYNHLPPDWFRLVAGYEHRSEGRWRWPDSSTQDRDNRAQIEDAAARAFHALPAKRRAALLATKLSKPSAEEKPKPVRKPRTTRAKKTP